jgi:hypothetical protein
VLGEEGVATAWAAIADLLAVLVVLVAGHLGLLGLFLAAALAVGGDLVAL